MKYIYGYGYLSIVSLKEYIWGNNVLFNRNIYMIEETVYGIVSKRLYRDCHQSQDHPVSPNGISIKAVPFSFSASLRNYNRATYSGGLNQLDN